MLNIFTLANGRLFQEEIESLEELSKFQPIWVDLESPTARRKALGQAVLRPVHPRGRDGRGHRGIRALL